jgi:hypothetical protein
LRWLRTLQPYILEGKLAGPWVDELERSRRALRDDSRDKLVLMDLCEVTFVDGEGRKLLTWMYEQGVRFRTFGCMAKGIIEEIVRECSRWRRVFVSVILQDRHRLKSLSWPRPGGCQSAAEPQAKLQVSNSRSYGENESSDRESLRAAKKLTKSSTTRRRCNQKQILRYAALCSE